MPETKHPEDYFKTEEDCLKFMKETEGLITDNVEYLKFLEEQEQINLEYEERVNDS